MATISTYSWPHSYSMLVLAHLKHRFVSVLTHAVCFGWHWQTACFGIEDDEDLLDVTHLITWTSNETDSEMGHSWNLPVLFTMILFLVMLEAPCKREGLLMCYLTEMCKVDNNCSSARNPAQICGISQPVRSHLTQLTVSYQCILCPNLQCKFHNQSGELGHIFAASSPNLSGHFAMSCINIPQYIPAKGEKGIKNQSAVVFGILALGKYRAHQSTRGNEHVCVCTLRKWVKALPLRLGCLMVTCSHWKKIMDSKSVLLLACFLI